MTFSQSRLLSSFCPSLKIGFSFGFGVFFLGCNAIMDEVARVRDNDFSTDAEEFMEGMVAIAVPIRDDLGRLMSTLSVHAPTQRISLEEMKGHLDRLRAATDDLAEMMLR